jgi:hypothetical protein
VAPLLIAEALIGGKTKELTDKIIEMALAGDPIALRVCIDKILPDAKQRPCTFKLPRFETCADAISALGLIAEGLASGELLPHEAESLSNVVATFVKTIETAMFEERLAMLEHGDDEDNTSRECPYNA